MIVELAVVWLLTYAALVVVGLVLYRRRTRHLRGALGTALEELGSANHALLALTAEQAPAGAGPCLEHKWPKHPIRKNTKWDTYVCKCGQTRTVRRWVKP